MEALCANCQLKAICDIYLRHKDKIQISKCAYKELTSNCHDICMSDNEIKDIRQYRDRDITVDLKTLYKQETKASNLGTCDACGLENVEVEECHECHKNICWNCACTNINDDYVYCPDCMDNDSIEI